MPEKTNPGKRKSENFVNLTFVKRANIENTSEEASLGLDQQQYENRERQSPFTNVPPDIFVEICSYLSLREVVKLGRVCWNWYSLTRSSDFWERTDLIKLNLSPAMSQRFLLKLPPCVKELRIGSSSSSRQTLSVPALYNTLSERFPILETLIIENACLAKPSCNFFLRHGFMLNCTVPVAQQIRRHFTVMQYRLPNADADFYTLISKLRDITVLSLRRTVLAVDDGLPCGAIRNIPSKIRILDLTLCACVMDKTIKSFCQLPFLQELYLAGTAITVNGVSIVLKEVTSLKVLDLDDTVIGGETFEELRKHGRSLVKLYIGNTAVKDSDMIDVNEETFPVLEKLCLQRTTVSNFGVNILLLSVHSLKEINVTKSKVKITWMLDQPAYIREKFQYDDSDDNKKCNHFLQNKFPGVF